MPLKKSQNKIPKKTVHPTSHVSFLSYSPEHRFSILTTFLHSHSRLVNPYFCTLYSEKMASSLFQSR